MRLSFSLAGTRLGFRRLGAAVSANADTPVLPVVHAYPRGGQLFHSPGCSRYAFCCGDVPALLSRDELLGVGVENKTHHHHLTRSLK